MKNFKAKILELHYGKKVTPTAFILFILLFIPNLIYFWVISTKNILYSLKFLKETKVKPYVICVGNLTTGGVGKTPVVIEIANNLSGLSKKVSVLSRGYGGELDNNKVHLVKDYNEILINDPDIVGDEINLISKRADGAAVVMCADRVKAANYAHEKLKAEIVIMDDGFSNRKIKKDMNIVLVDNQKVFGNCFFLPLGPLREPISQLKRANRIMIVDKGVYALQAKVKTNSKLTAQIGSFGVPTIPCNMVDYEIYNIKTGENLFEVLYEKFGENMSEAFALAFSGIGQPEQFYERLKNKMQVKETVDYSDHAKYTQKNVDELNALSEKIGANVIITTEKDMVKIAKFDNIENFYAMKVRANFDLDKLLKHLAV